MNLGRAHPVLGSIAIAASTFALGVMLSHSPVRSNHLVQVSDGGLNAVNREPAVVEVAPALIQTAALSRAQTQANQKALDSSKHDHLMARAVALASDNLLSEVEKILAQATFTTAELDQMDYFARRFPNTGKAFQKLCALEKIQAQISNTEYEAVSDEYVSQLKKNPEEAKNMLNSVLNTASQDEDQVSLRAVAYFTAGKLDYQEQSLNESAWKDLEQAGSRSSQSYGENLNNALEAAMMSLMLSGATNQDEGSARLSKLAADIAARHPDAKTIQVPDSAIENTQVASQ